MRLMSPLRFFAFNLLVFEAAVGLVFLRGFGGINDFRTSSTNLRRASSRFCSWVRKRRASISSSPSEVARFPARASSRVLASSGSEEACTSNRNCTAVATLFTFCPPGPAERMKSKCSSRSSMDKLGVISSIIKTPTPALPYFRTSENGGGCRRREGDQNIKALILSIISGAGLRSASVRRLRGMSTRL